jgi:cytochrome c peroxidase
MIKKGTIKFLPLLAIIIFGCVKSRPLDTKNIESLTKTPQNFPKMLYPLDNQHTIERWELGKRLFFDPHLSIDSTVSCASCHLPQNAFANLQTTTSGVFNRPGTRNSPSLANIGYHPYYTREGGVPSLEMQILVPVQEHNEFAFNIIDLQERLQKSEEYNKMSQKAYNRNIDYFSIVRAIATFERSLISGNSAFDKYSNGNKKALSISEQKGLALFFSSKTNCSSCHTGINFTNYNFESNGLYDVYPDNGRERFTRKSTDAGNFKIASLRNVGITAPYMHDGSLESLEAVIEHYNSGGKDHSNKSSLIKPLNLTLDEKANLKAFLLSLTDFQFINNPNFKP